MYWYLPQSGALPRARQVSWYQYRRGPRDGQPAEQWRGDEGHFYQAHPGGQSCWTERDPEDWRQDRRGKGTWRLVLKLTEYKKPEESGSLRFWVTDRLFSLISLCQVDGVDLRDASHEEAVEAIRRAGNPVPFLVQSIIHRPRVSLFNSVRPIASKHLIIWRSKFPHCSFFLTSCESLVYQQGPFRALSKQYSTRGSIRFAFECWKKVILKFFTRATTNPAWHIKYSKF